MRVLHIIDSLGEGGGAEHALRLQLPELTRRGVESAVIVLRHRPGHLAEEVRQEGIRVCVLRSSGRIAAAREVSSLIRTWKPDLVHATLFESCLASRLATPRGVPLLNSLVSTPYASVRVDRLAASKWKRNVVRIVDAVTARRVDHFHAITIAAAEHARQALGISSELITVIPRGRSAEAMGEVTSARRARVRSELGIAESQLVAVNVARQEPPKAQAFLIRAFRRVRASVPDAMLVIVGRRGAASRELEQAILEEEASGYVRVLGYRTDVADILSACDVFVFPSWYEGLGSALIEAMAMRLPIVASDIPAISEVLDGGRVGRLVPSGSQDLLVDALIELFDDPVERNELGQLGHEWFAHRFELRSVVDDTVGLYEAIVQD